MEWTNDLVLALVHSYRDHAVLWDPNSPHFKIKARRDTAWEEIAKRLGSDTVEVKKKMNSVLASFRRERSKVLKSGSETDDIYESRWFAFDSFQFLMDRTAPRQYYEFMEPITDYSYNIQEFDCATIIKSELDDQPEEVEIRYPPPEQNLTAEDQSTAAQTGIRGVDFNNRKPKMQKDVLTKRKLQYYDPRVSSLCKIARKLNNEHEKRDECKAFSEYLTFKLRNYEFHTRSTVQHMINNIIYDADMGKYSKAEIGKHDKNLNTNCDSVSLLTDDKMVPQNIDYLQQIG